MSKIQTLWGLAKVLMPEGLAAPFIRRAVVDGRQIDVSAQAASDLVQLVRDPNVMLSVAESRAQLEQLTARFDVPRPTTVTTRDWAHGAAVSCAGSGRGCAAPAVPARRRLDTGQHREP